MSTKYIRSIIYCWVILVPAIEGNIDIDTDYIFDDDALRMSKNRDCDSQEFMQYCEVLCGGSHTCLLGKCYCLEPSHKGNEDHELQVKKKAVQNEKNFFDDYGYIVFRPIIHQIGYKEKPVLRSKPALRHHIAHFCPNLDVARTCIRECMKFGKPAFCGKDHVCYCGHKYDNSDDAQELSVADVHEQFRDLYLKYFGPEYKKK